MARLTWKEREARKVQAEIRRRTIRDLRARIRAAKTQKREALGAVRRSCKAARGRLRAAVKLKRAEAKAALRAEIAMMRAEARGRCRSRLEKVRALGKTKHQLQKMRLAGERQLQAELRRTGLRLRKTHARRVAELREESDDEVRGNIPEDLLSVWERVKGSIHASERMSRTERFFHWVEENPDEAVVLQNVAADRATELMIEELQRLEAEHYARAG